MMHIYIQHFNSSLQLYDAFYKLSVTFHDVTLLYHYGKGNVTCALFHCFSASVLPVSVWTN